MFSLIENYKQLITLTLLIFLVFLKRKFNYWKNKNVPYVYLGNFRNFPYLVQKPYQYFKLKGHKFFGIYLLLKPVLIVIDLNLIKLVLLNDFQHFIDHGRYYNERDDPLSGHLFSLEGARWKNLRIKLTPAFSSGKMKIMFQALLHCSEEFVKYVEKSAEKGEELDIQQVLACFHIDATGSCEFGLNCNCFIEPNSIFRKYCNKFFDTNYTSSTIQGLQYVFPNLARLFRSRVIPEYVSDLFYNITKIATDYRIHNNVTRQDLLQLLTDMKRKENINEDNGKDLNATKLTMEEMAAQSLIFFMAGFKGPATTTTFCMYELSMNLDIQEKVRNEIEDVLTRHNGEVIYNALMEMTYMQQVINETLRKYPPLPFLFRICTKDYTIPETNTKLEKGVGVLLPIYQIHRDAEYYPDPEEFKPERFGEKQKNTIPQYAYLPFGEGQRICLGFRFGIMQTKVALIKLLQNYRFTLNEKTPSHLQFDPNRFFLSSKDSIYLNATKV